MASITRESNGRKTIQFVASDKRRRSLRLGKYSMRTAETVRVHVEAILTALSSRSPLDRETAEWIGKIGDDLHAKLAAVHLVEPREPEAAADSVLTLAGLQSAFDASKLKAKPSTRTVWGHTWRNLKECFGEDTAIASITEADAERWAEWLDVEEKLSQPTIRNCRKFARQFFAFAVKKRQLASNPFGGLKVGNLSNRTRDHFITRADAKLVLV